MTPAELRQHIDTIVIVLLENRSFDHILGHLRLPAYGGRADVEGLADLTNPAYLNPSKNAAMVAPFIATDSSAPNDLPHERPFVAQQIAFAQAAGTFVMNGFVRAYEDFTGTTGVLKPPPMGILPPEFLPITSFLAREYSICDRWFAPLPTSTQPNRLMATSGDTKHDATQAGLLPDQDLFFDWLDRHHVPWRVYSAGLSFFTMMPKMWLPMLGDHFASLSEMARDFQNEANDTFPNVLFVEPDYDDSPVHLSGHASDNHPPLPVAFGELFLKTVYDSITSNPARWAKTAMVFTYDEHGGFFDHVPPARVPYPPPAGATFAQPFVSTGVRVPAVVVSPFVERGGVSHSQCDHTSILQLLAERFGAPGEPYSASVAARRAAGIQSVSAALNAATPARPTPPAPTTPIAASVTLSDTRAPLTTAQTAFATAIQAFATKHGQLALTKYPEIAHWLATQKP